MNDSRSNEKYVEQIMKKIIGRAKRRVKKYWHEYNFKARTHVLINILSTSIGSSYTKYI